jgi:hypothetical protein
MIQITLPIQTVSEANIREHWSVKANRARMQRQFTKITLGPHFRKIMVTGRFTITLVRVGARPLDSDNLARSFKAIRDGVADAIGIDDGSALLTWKYNQVKGKPKEYAVKIQIEPHSGEGNRS